MNADSYGDALDCTLKEITKLHKTIAAQAAVIERQKEAIAEYLRNPAGDYTEDIMAEAFAIPTDSTQILDEVRRAERELQLAGIPLDDIKQALTKYSEMLVHVDCSPVYRKHLVEILDKAQAAIRAME